MYDISKWPPIDTTPWTLSNSMLEPHLSKSPNLNLAKIVANYTCHCDFFSYQQQDGELQMLLYYCSAISPYKT